jgi:hypothetical protein
MRMDITYRWVKIPCFGLTIAVALATLLLVALPPAVSASANSGTWSFYPKNEAARKVGKLTGQYIGETKRHGTVTVKRPDGEVLKGEYNLENTWTKRWSASFSGNHGTSMECKYKGPYGSGTGTCSTSKGEIFDLRF